MLKNRLLPILLLFATNVFAALPNSNKKSAPGCDTLLTIEGKIYVCNILHQDKQEIQFSLCDDPKGTVYAIPNQRVSSLKKAKETAVASKPVQEGKKPPIPPTEKPGREKGTRPVEQIADNALTYGVFSIFLSASLLLSPVGLILGISAILKGQKVLKMTKGNPAARKLRRKARWAIALGAIGSVFAVLLLVGFIYLLNALSHWANNLDNLSGGFSLDHLLGG